MGLLDIFSFQGMLDFAFQNMFFFIAIGVGVFVFINYISVKRKKKLQPVNIADIERMKFIERMKNNKPIRYDWLYRGKNQCLGKIVAMRGITISTPKSNPKQHRALQFLIKPMLISRGKIRVTRPLSKLIPMQINEDMLDGDKTTREIKIPQWLALDAFAGIYYDGSIEKVHVDFITEHNLFRSITNQLASTFFSKSQEQSTFDPEHAHQLAMKEKELQIELAKKKGKITTI